MIDSLSFGTFLSTGSQSASTAKRARRSITRRRKVPADMTIAIPDGSTPVESITFTKETQL